MILLISSSDLVSLYLSIEMQSLSLYILASSKQNSIFSIEAGIKYFVLGTVSSGFLLLGSSFLYGYSGITRFFEFIMFFQNDVDYDSIHFIFFSSILFFIAFLFKFGAAPFHIWVPDIYEGSPTIATFFFSLVPKITLMALILRLSSEIFLSFEHNWQNFILYSAIFSFFIGSVGGLFQHKIKRLLAYSSIANAGFFLSGFLGQNLHSFVSSFIYFLVYSLISIFFFILIITTRFYNNNLKIKNIFEYAGLLNLNSYIVIFFIINLFSLIGIPPLAGFFGKLFLFFSIISNDSFLLLITAMLASVLSGYFYLRVVRILLFKRYSGFFFLTPINEIQATIYTLLTLFNIIFAIDLFYFFKIIYNLFATSFMSLELFFIV
jgi:NADH-quinone oxidoreductase subunit N